MKYWLPEDYIEQSDVVYFDDSPYCDTSVIHQPEVYDAASHFIVATGRSKVIDIGCGNGRKLLSISAPYRIGLDFGSNLALCRDRYPSDADWREIDLSNSACLVHAALADNDAVVVCADVVEHLADPKFLLSLLAECYRRGAIVLTSTPDRIRVRGHDHLGPPPNPSHIREWALEEYKNLLAEHGLPSLFAGYTINNNIDRKLNTIVTVHDQFICDSAPSSFDPVLRPLAILATYNEFDIVAEVVEDLLSQGCDIAAIDNWSSDGTVEILNSLAESYPDRITVERFPLEGPAKHYEWASLLSRKQEIAVANRGRWILHVDADEIRRAPFIGMSLAQALSVAQRAGATRVDFTCVNFRPVESSPSEDGTLEQRFSHFEFGTKPGHFVQKKAWLQGEDTVDLVSSGGHEANFSTARDFAWKFLLRHYPIRSKSHGYKKVIQDRQGRWSPHEYKTLGWHRHYDDFNNQSTFCWDSSQLEIFTSDFWANHGLVVVTDIAKRRYESIK
jgi:SAM-dependent methyltransferase